MNTYTQSTSHTHTLFVARRIYSGMPAQCIALCDTLAGAQSAIERDKRGTIDAGERNYTIHTVQNPILYLS